MDMGSANKLSDTVIPAQLALLVVSLLAGAAGVCSGVELSLTLGLIGAVGAIGGIGSLATYFSAFPRSGALLLGLLNLGALAVAATVTAYSRAVIDGPDIGLGLVLLISQAMIATTATTLIALAVETFLARTDPADTPAFAGMTTAAADTESTAAEDANRG